MDASRNQPGDGGRARATLPTERVEFLSTEEAGMEASVRGVSAHGERSALSQHPVLKGLRVALVHDWLTGMRGGEKCLEVLCRAFPDATLHTLIHRRGAVSPAIESMRIHTSPLQHLPGVFRNYRKLLPVMPMAARAWRTGDVDLVVSLSHCVAKSVRVPKGVPHVCYCFTPMRYAWQGRDAYLEAWSERPFRQAMAKVLLNRMRDWDRAAAERVSHFVAISETVRERISRCYGRESQVIQPPVNTHFYTPAAENDAARDKAPYLVVSALVPYKKIDQAVTACSFLGRSLVVIGEGPERARLERLASPSVTFLGWQPDEVIRHHYRRCKALLFPGEEDFGIVPIEALACGGPVIALAKGGASETVDERVGRTYTAATAEGLLEAIESWEADGSPHDPEFARRKAEAYALPRFEDRLLGYLTGVVSGQVGDRVPPSPHLEMIREVNEVARLSNAPPL
jgi:glycosyltransferase involved in cell wall biosynthesis